jgi:hypothetical protein
MCQHISSTCFIKILRIPSKLPQPNVISYGKPSWIHYLINTFVMYNPKMFCPLQLLSRDGKLDGCGEPLWVAFASKPSLEHSHCGYCYSYWHLTPSQYSKYSKSMDVLRSVWVLRFTVWPRVLGGLLPNCYPPGLTLSGHWILLAWLAILKLSQHAFRTCMKEKMTNFLALLVSIVFSLSLSLSLSLTLTLSTRVWPQGFALPRQALYHLSHTSIPFHTDYFGDIFSRFAQAGLDNDPPILYFLQFLGWQVHTTAFSHWDGGLTNFLAWTGLEPWSPLSQPPR